MSQFSKYPNTYASFYRGGDSYKDALFFSVHKFVGGPQTPGILVAKKRLFEAGETFPHQSGGGTVNFVRREHTSYFKVG